MFLSNTNFLASRSSSHHSVSKVTWGDLHSSHLGSSWCTRLYQTQYRYFSLELFSMFPKALDLMQNPLIFQDSEPLLSTLSQRMLSYLHKMIFNTTDHALIPQHSGLLSKMSIHYNITCISSTLVLTSLLEGEENSWQTFKISFTLTKNIQLFLITWHQQGALQESMWEVETFHLQDRIHIPCSMRGLELLNSKKENE